MNDGTPKNGLSFEITRLFLELLQFKTVLCHPLVIFGAKTKNPSKEISDFTHYSPGKITSVTDTAYFLLNF